MPIHASDRSLSETCLHPANRGKGWEISECSALQLTETYQIQANQKRWLLLYGRKIVRVDGD